MKTYKNINKYLLSAGFVLLIISSCSTNSRLTDIHQLLVQQDRYAQANNHHYAQFVSDHEKIEFVAIEKAMESTTDKGGKDGDQ